MRVKHDGVIYVNYPAHASAHDITHFVRSHVEWIEKQRKKTAANRKIYQIGNIFTTKFHSVEILSTNKPTGYASIANGKAIICIPISKEIENESVQQFILKVLDEVLRREAKAYLPLRLTEFATLHGLKYNEVFFKKLKSKWGSCSNKGNINLNIYLMKLPDHLIDFILLHELAHLVEHNHGSNFHQLLNKLTNGNEAALNKELRKYSHLIER
jgi:predicted metal-dependent hydrolase